MTTIDRSMFWKYTIPAMVCALFITIMVNFGYQETSLATQEYQTWQQYHAWNDRAKKQVAQYNFELAIADPDKLYLLKDDHRLEHIANTVRTQQSWYSRTLSYPVSWALSHDTAFSLEFNQDIEQWQRCADGQCSYTTPLQVLGEKQRLKKLLAGDTTATIPPPNTIIPQQYQAVSALSEAPAIKYHPYPSWWPYLIWIVFSLCCGIGYFGYGLFLYSFPAGGYYQEQHHPFRAVPNFILGWLLIVLWLPGFLLGHLLWKSYKLFTCPVAEIRESATTLWRSLTFKTPHDEYTEIYDQLVELQNEADQQSNTQLVQEIAQTLNTIKKARSVTDTDTTQHIREKLAKAKIAIRVHQEIGRITRS